MILAAQDINWPACIAIVGLIAYWVVEAITSHRERMEKIKQHRDEEPKT